MRITHVNLAKGFRGGERQTLNLVEGLANLGAEQTLLCREGSELERRGVALGVDTISVSHPLFGHIFPPDADLIHVHEARGAYWAAIEYKMRKTRYIITRRIPNPISGTRVTTNVYRCAARLFGVSEDVSARLSSQVGRPVHTVLSATSKVDAAPHLVREIRREIGSGPIIGHVGALHDHHKGQSVLIEAFHLLTKEFPHARLVLVGDGPDRAELERLAKGDRRVVFVGFQEEVGAWIAAMDVFCFPSREEGLGSSVLDAMSLGVPVIAAAVGGIPELIGKNERGLLLYDHLAENWSESICRLIREPSRFDPQKSAARLFSASNCVTAMSKSYWDIYTDILSAKNSRSIAGENQFAGNILDA